MPRNKEEVRKRLQQAAMELIAERGYDATTTAEIAARAGVTERTFFRHFPDKREALFHGEEAFRDALREGVLAAPVDLPPMAALLHAFRGVEQTIEANRPFTEPRQALIHETPALRERVLTKTAGLIEGLAAALVARGVDEGLALLAAQAGMAAMGYAMRGWMRDPAPSLDGHLTRAFEAMEQLSAGLDRKA